MTDQISGGPARRRGARAGLQVPGRRWTVSPARSVDSPSWLPQVAALGLLAVLLGYAVTHRESAPTGPAAGTSAAAPATDPQPESPWLGGRRSSGPTGLRLLVAGANPRVVDAGTGAVTTPPGVRLVPDMGIAAFPDGRSRIAVVQYAWAAGSVLLLPGADPQILGRHATVSRGFDGDLIIVSSPVGGSTVLGVGADPRVRWQWQTRDALTVVADTPLGLVLQRSGPTADDRDLVLVDRGSGAVRRLLGHDVFGVAAADRAAAWLPANCADPCSLVVGDLRTADRRDYPMPDGPPDSGAFSPDGRLLALTFPATRAGRSGSGAVGVLDLRSGAVALVPGLRTAPELGANLAWSPDSRWLVIGVPWSDHQAVALWRPGDPVLHVLPSQVDGRPGPISVLP
jgi:hypothetical protein